MTALLRTPKEAEYLPFRPHHLSPRSLRVPALVGFVALAGYIASTDA